MGGRWGQRTGTAGWGCQGDAAHALLAPTPANHANGKKTPNPEEMRSAALSHQLGEGPSSWTTITQAEDARRSHPWLCPPQFTFLQRRCNPYHWHKDFINLNP